MLWAFMPVFVVSNLVAFQPWDWDNSKVLAYWFLAACILVSAALTKMWREFATTPFRLFLIATVLSMTLSGFLENLEQLLARDRHQLATREELGLAETVRRATDPHAIFAAGLQHNHPIPMLSGRLTDAIADRKSGGERSWSEIAVIGVVVAVVAPAKDLMRYASIPSSSGPTRKKDGADLDLSPRLPDIARTDSYDVFTSGPPSALLPARNPHPALERLRIERHAA
jgi:hypothetical protein